MPDFNNFARHGAQHKNSAFAWNVFYLCFLMCAKVLLLQLCGAVFLMHGNEGMLSIVPENSVSEHGPHFAGENIFRPGNWRH